ncbi:MAG TPA: hypothetical protein PLE19_17785 [Planctomycetota bacterium]|nr:hypothetical protein [Planctomycetota bacterium]HRR80879.1 hypothetical protein [Planctomycetota bacterium]HRT96093.1 hypothetical protein [Planctomycetota bacterium]
MLRRLSVVLVIAVSAASVSAADKLEVTVAESGLGRLAWSGTNLLKDGRPQVKRIVFEHETLDAKQEKAYSFDRLDGSNPKASFDAAARRLTYGYPWGSVSFAYAPAADRLGIAVTLTNDSKFAIADFEIEPLGLAFPAPPAKPKQGRWIETLPDRLGVVEATFGAARLLLCCETMIPLNFGLAAGGKSESPVVLKGGVMMMEPGAVFYHYLGLPRVEPGKSLAIAFSLRFAPAEGAEGKPPADLCEAFRTHHQPRIAWKDRRPIGTIFVGKGKGPENNPRNWFDKKDLDVRTPEGKAELRKLFMEFADRCIKSLKKTNAQGMIVWDPEGAENPHPITYVGDPRMVKVLAPEVEDIYPEFFKKFLDAGLRTGCCIRPTQVYLEAKKGWSHGTGSHGPERNPLGDDFSAIWPKGLPWWRFYPLVERMCRKIEYARKNWGCTIFYVDTNGVYRQAGEKQEFGWALLDSHVWRDVARRHPDVLLIPELGTGAPAQWAYAAQYLQPPYSGARTPPEVLELLPGAFSVCQSVNLSPADWDKRRGELLEGVRHGDSLFFRGWFDDGYNAKIKELYDQAYPPGAIAPPAASGQ